MPACALLFRNFLLLALIFFYVAEFYTSIFSPAVYPRGLGVPIIQ